MHITSPPSVGSKCLRPWHASFFVVSRIAQGLGGFLPARFRLCSRSPSCHLRSGAASKGHKCLITPIGEKGAQCFYFQRSARIIALPTPGHVPRRVKAFATHAAFRVDRLSPQNYNYCVARVFLRKKGPAHAPFLRCSSVFHQFVRECHSCPESRCCSRPSRRWHRFEISCADPSSSDGRGRVRCAAQRHRLGSKNAGLHRFCRRSRRRRISRHAGRPASFGRRGDYPFRIRSAWLAGASKKPEPSRGLSLSTLGYEPHPPPEILHI